MTLALKIVNLSELGESLRMEAEFYTSEASSSDWARGSSITAFSQYGTSKGLNEENLGYPVLRLNEFVMSFAGSPKKYCDLLSVNEYDGLKLKANDVLICRTNGNPTYVGKAALVMEDMESAFASYLFRIRPNNDISPATLVAFLNSKAGRKEIEKYSIVSNQANFSPAKFRQISIPRFDSGLQKKIEHSYSAAWDDYQTAKSLLFRAGALIVKAMNLDSTFTSDGISVRSLKESSSVSRLDAEYWQTHYDDIEDVIKSSENGFDSLSSLFDVVESKMKVDSNTEYEYAELADINDDIGVIDKTTSLLGSELPSRGRMALGSDDIVLPSVEGSLAKVALIRGDQQNLVGSTGFFVLRQNKISPEVALVLLKSDIIQKLLKRQAQGTILPAIPRTSLNRVLIPNIPKNTQVEVKDLVHLALSKFETAKEILASAESLIDEELS